MAVVCHLGFDQKRILAIPGLRGSIVHQHIECHHGLEMQTTQRRLLLKIEAKFGTYSY